MPMKDLLVLVRHAKFILPAYADHDTTSDAALREIVAAIESAPTAYMWAVDGKLSFTAGIEQNAGDQRIEVDRGQLVESIEVAILPYARHDNNVTVESAGRKNPATRFIQAEDSKLHLPAPPEKDYLKVTKKTPISPGVLIFIEKEKPQQIKKLCDS